MRPPSPQRSPESLERSRPPDRIDQYFAYFNRGPAGAGAGYAGHPWRTMRPFKIYPTIPEAERPWRMLWYQTGRIGLLLFSAVL